MSADRAQRAERLSELVAERELDQLIVGDLVRPGDTGPDAMANVRWLAGFNGTSAVALIGPETRDFITDFRYAERAAKQVDPSFERTIAESRLLPELASHLRGRVGYDDAATSVANLAKLEEELPEGVELVAAGGLVEKLRRAKDAGEIESIAEAARLADEVYEAVVAEGLVGRSEREVARAAHAAIRERGAEPSFPASWWSGTWARSWTATARTAPERSRRGSPMPKRARPMRSSRPPRPPAWTRSAPASTASRPTRRRAP